MKLSLVLQKIGYFVTLFTVLLLPIFFLPVTSEFYDFNKNILLIVSSLILALILTLSFVFDRQVRLVRSPLGLPLLLIAITWLASTLLRSPNRFDAFLDPGQTGSVIALVLFFTTSVNFLRTKKEIESLAFVLITSITLLGASTILWSSELLPKLLSSIPSLQYLASPLWTPTGVPLSTILAITSLIPFIIVLIIKEKNLSLKTYLLALSLLINISGVGLLSYRLAHPPTGTDKPAFLPHSTAWAISLEALKISPLLGTGPATFLSDFTQFRPLAYNLTPNWATRFTSSSNYPFQLLATVGTLGLAAYLFFVWRAFHLALKTLKITHNSAAPYAHPLALAALASAFTLLALQLVFPVHPLPLFLLFILLAIAVASLKQLGASFVHEANFDLVATASSDRSPLLAWIIFIVVLILALPSFYLVGRAYAAEVLFQNALTSASNNDGKTTYDTLIKTIQANPYRDSYRVVYSQINLLLANSLATGEKLSDADRTTVTQLVQQAIREAKNAAALNPQKVTNLENLAGVYRNLLNFAQGADAWTIASYRQAILLDPINPNLRIALGGVFYAQKNYDDAIRFFQSAVDLKSDLANAHYNLAAAYREKGEYAKALPFLETAVQLVDKTSPDFTKANSDLDDRQKKLPVASPTPTPPPHATQLTAPEPLPTPIVNPPLELDESLSPAASPTPPSQP